jgi:hypothetical protein
MSHSSQLITVRWSATRDKTRDHGVSEKFLLARLELQQSATCPEISIFSRVLARKRGGCIVYVCRQF